MTGNKTKDLYKKSLLVLEEAKELVDTEITKDPTFRENLSAALLAVYTQRAMKMLGEVEESIKALKVAEQELVINIKNGSYKALLESPLGGHSLFEDLSKISKTIAEFEEIKEEILNNLAKIAIDLDKHHIDIQKISTSKSSISFNDLYKLLDQEAIDKENKKRKKKK